MVALCMVAQFGAHADSGSEGDGSFFKRWMDTAKQSKEDQPHWITPLVTVTPRLEQEFRYDQTMQSQSKGISIDSYGGGKGLELIPSYNTEVIIGVPAYQVREQPHKATVHGWADETLLLKYRFLSANEEHGNYIVTGFLGLSVPTGDDAFTKDHTIITPTIAAGKGWGSRESGFDIQTTLGAGFSDGGEHELGIPVVWNTAFQLHVFEYFWPEVEAQYTYWHHGEHDGKSQLIMTYGATIGRFRIAEGSNLIIGAGYQVHQGTSFSTFNHGWVATARVTF